MHVIDNANQSHRSKQHFLHLKILKINRIHGLLRIIVTIELNTGMSSLLTNVK